MPTAGDFGTEKTVSRTSTSFRNWAGRLFSFPVMCIFLLAPLIVVYAPRGMGVGEPDIWYRLRSATDFLQHPAFIPIDTYSFTAAGLPWTNFEWLSDLCFLTAFKIMGLPGIVGVYSAAMMLIVAGIYYRSIRTGADCKDAAIATVGGLCLAAVSLAPRPLLFGWLCLTGLLLLLDHFRETGRGLWLMPPLFLVWINLHGSWIYGIAVLVITILAGTVNGHWGRIVADRWSSADFRKLVTILIASTAALFGNPLGYKLVVFPFEYFRIQGFMRYVEYWRPVDFGTWNGKLALCLIFAILFSALFSRRRWRLDEVLLVVFALWSALFHVRFLDFAAIIIVPVLTPRLKLFPPYEPELDKRLLNGFIMAAAVVACIYLFPSSVELEHRVAADYPVAALQYMHSHHIQGKIFSPDEFGGFIEWTAPEFKSFVDGRAVFVQTAIFDESMRILLLDNSNELLQKYGIDYVLIEPSWPLNYLLQHSALWRPVYSDDVATIFQRLPAPAPGSSVN